MPKKTLYIKEEDIKIWEQAEELAPASLSNYITTLLKKEVANKMEKRRDSNFTKIVVKVDLEDNGDELKKVAFKGRWLFEEKSGYDETLPQGTVYSVAITAKDKLFMLYEKFGAQEFHEYKIYDDFNEMKDSGEVPSEILNAVADEIGEDYEEFLDI